MRGNRAWHASSSQAGRGEAGYDYDYDVGYEGGSVGYAQTMSDVRSRVKDVRPRGRFGERRSTAETRREDEARRRRAHAADVQHVRHTEDLDRDRFWLRQNDAFVRSNRRSEAVQRFGDDYDDASSPTRPPYAVHETDDADDENEVPQRRFKEPARKIATRVWEKKKINRGRGRKPAPGVSSVADEPIGRSSEVKEATKRAMMSLFSIRPAKRGEACEGHPRNFDGTYDVKYSNGGRRGGQKSRSKRIRK